MKREIDTVYDSAVSWLESTSPQTGLPQMQAPRMSPFDVDGVNQRTKILFRGARARKKFAADSLRAKSTESKESGQK